MPGALFLTLLVGGEGVVIRHDVQSSAQGAYFQVGGGKMFIDLFCNFYFTTDAKE
jgi:hypothetical protein